MQRRQNGIYYTSEKNILKVINPLFLEDLQIEFEKAKGNTQKLNKLQNKISNLKFLDPACGCGNFFIVTYFHLAELENKILQELIKFGCKGESKVNAGQFYGIEIDEKACKLAEENLKIAYREINDIYKLELNKAVSCMRPFIPPQIINENALRIDWNDVISKKELNYIMGNPPFVGYHLRNQEQKEDMALVFGEGFKRYGILDYVTAWYKKASDYMKDTKIESAFVSTNSISQGEQPAILWEPLMKENNTIINFAHKTFKWTNEAKGKKAGVHCVIIGFSDYKNNKKKKIFSEGTEAKNAENINPYLTDTPNILVERRGYPICNVLEMVYGNKPTDGGFLILNNEEKEKIIKESSLSGKWIRPFMGAEEFLNGKKRWCLWLVNANPSEIRKCKPVMNRVNSVRKFRLKSKAVSTRKASNIPTLFKDIRQPNSRYLTIPEVTSEKRKYIPMDFMEGNTVASNLLHIIANANLYHFGVLTSIVHMAWMRAVCGRLGNEYRYSNTLVYNNFIWPDPTAEQKAKIEECAQGVLDARDLYPDSTLADLYDPNTMPPELLKAHENLDKAVKVAYGNKGFETEEEIIASLMKLYKKAIDEENNAKRERPSTFENLTKMTN